MSWHFVILARGVNLSNRQSCFEVCSFFHTKFVSGKGIVVGWDKAAEEDKVKGMRAAAAFF